MLNPDRIKLNASIKKGSGMWITTVTGVSSTNRTIIGLSRDRAASIKDAKVAAAQVLKVNVNRISLTFV